MKILLASCDFAPVSLALLSVKSYAQADPVLAERAEIRIVSGTVPEDPEDVLARIIHAAREHQPEIVGLSVYIWSRWMLYEASRRLRMLLPHALIVWGGPDVSDEDYSVELLAKHPHLDVVVRDEGELTFARLVHHRLGSGPALADIRGITWRDAETGAAVVNPQVDFLDDLDQIPSIVEMPEVRALLPHTDMFALETFRGCYMGCAYCYWGGSRRRAFSMERVYHDLGTVLAHPNIKKIWFFDSMFGYKKQIAKDLLRFIVARKAPDQCVTFFPNLDFVDDELCLLMKEAGVYIEAGIQTTNEEAYEYLNRKWDKRFLDSKIPLLQKHGLHANSQQLILGLPGDNLRGFRESVDYAFGTHPESITIFPFSVLPATGYWRRREEFKMRYEGQYRIIYDSTTFPENDMVVGGLIMAGTKWFEHFPGLAIQIVRLLDIRPSDLFEKLGRTFMEEHWGLVDAPATRPEVRRRLLTQAFSPEDVAHLDVALLERTLRRFDLFGGREVMAAELMRLHAVLNCDEVLDARTAADAAIEGALQEWRAHPHGLAPQTAAFNVFDPETWEAPPDERRPVEFVAYPVAGPRDFFGKDLPRYRVVVTGEPGRLPQAAVAS